MPVALVISDNEIKHEDQLSDTVFACYFNEPLVHQVVTAYLAGRRQGTRAQKNRSAVSGGGKKPWKQKGMGRARAGTTRSPLWRGGGVTFAASTQDFSQKVNKKMYRSAMRSICSELLRQERFIIVDSLSLEAAKTKGLIKKLNEFDLDKQDKKMLIILEQFDRNIYFAARNIPHVEVIDVEDINPVDLINSEKILLTASTLKKIGERLS